MAEERAGTQGMPTYKPKPASWTKVFGTFLVALDPFKLLVAAAGIMATALGWWLISVIFYYSWSIPRESEFERKAPKDLGEVEKQAWVKREYGKSLGTWALMHELAGPSDRPNADYARYYLETYQQKHPGQSPRNRRLAEGYGGKYRTMPWAENRGPNPYLMTRTVVGGTGEERRDALSQFVTYQLPNLVEPLLKFLTPVYYLFDHRASFWVYLYLLFLIIWLLVVWAFFGGIITRMAIMDLTGKEGGGVVASFKYVKRRYLSYLLSPLVPIAFIGFLMICCMLFGVLHWIPILGDLIDGLFWWLPLLAGLVMTLTLVGMVGYPLMYTTLSAEGSDTFDSLSRSYNYVYESPWHYLWYCLVAIAYGAMLTLFVVVVGSLSTYLAKWGVSKFPAWGSDRSPEYLFIYSPESLGWRQLLTQGSPAEIDDAGKPVDPEAYAKYMKEYEWYNEMGAGMTSFWIVLVFLMVIGFSYSYFWTASSQIYLLMRKRVDETELDEVYVEEEAPEAPPLTEMPATPAPAPTPTPTGPVSVPVDPPTLRQPEPPTASPGGNPGDVSCIHSR